MAKWGPVLGQRDQVCFRIQEVHSFAPFSAALASLSQEERLEADLSGVSGVLQRYANREMQRFV